MRNIFASRWVKASAAAAIAALGLVATTTGAEARYCANWRHGHCVDWRHSGGYDPGPAAALNAFGNIMGAAIAASQPRYYYPPPPPAYYYPPPQRYYYPPPAYGYYGPEPMGPSFGLRIR